MKKHFLLALLLVLAPITVTLAQPKPQPAPPGALSKPDRQAIVQALVQQLDANYVFPEIATQVSRALTVKDAAGGYDGASIESLSDALTKDMREFGKDSHFRVRYEPRFSPPPGQTPPLPTADEVVQGRMQAASEGFGIGKIERLEGNVGYMEIRGFLPTELVAAEYTAAIMLLSGSDALILDLRRNGGGEPSSVAHLMSHFFAPGDKRHLNDIYTRTTDSTQQYWTNPAVAVRYSKPVYVLTSAHTFSGGEECAYDFQTQKRATLVGEVTGGGANPGDMFALAKGLVAFIPTGKAINPVTGTNWEHVGVKPDIAVPADAAQQTAHVAILERLLADAKDPRQRDELQQALKSLQGDTDAVAE